MRKNNRHQSSNSTPVTAKDILCETLGLPKTVTQGLNYMEMLSNREAVVDGCKGILDYSEEKIKINLGNKTVCFVGSDLCIKSLGDEQAVISGNFCTIDFT